MLIIVEPACGEVDVCLLCLFMGFIADQSIKTTVFL